MIRHCSGIRHLLFEAQGQRFDAGQFEQKVSQVIGPHVLRHHVDLTAELHPIAGLELAAALGFLKPIHPRLAALDALLGLPTGEHQPLPFKELIEPEGQKSADSLP